MAKPRSSIESSDEHEVQLHGLASGPLRIKPKELRMARAVWARAVEPQKAVFGREIFRELFLRYPEYEFFFLHMREHRESKSDIFESNAFKNHMSERMVGKLRDIMDQLDQPEQLADTMSKLGLYHGKLQVGQRHMDDMRSVILAALKNVGGDKVQKEEEIALDHCLTQAFTLAFK